MYKIIKQSLNSRNDILGSIEYCYINCSEEELFNKLIHRLHNLAKLLTLNSRVRGGNIRVRFLVKEAKPYSFDNIMAITRGEIKAVTDDINHYIVMANSATKMSNRRNSRNINDNLIKEINPLDYILGECVTLYNHDADNCIIID